MSETEEPRPGEGSEEVPLEKRFPVVPSAPDIPEAPRVTTQLPPDPSKVQVEGRVKPGDNRNLGLAMTAAGTFVGPIIVLSLAGYFADAKFKTKGVFVFIGLVVGLIVGVMNLLRISAKMSE